MTDIAMLLVISLGFTPLLHISLYYIVYYILQVPAMLPNMLKRDEEDAVNPRSISIPNIE